MERSLAARFPDHARFYLANSRGSTLTAQQTSARSDDVCDWRCRNCDSTYARRVAAQVVSLGLCRSCAAAAAGRAGSATKKSRSSTAE
jgi:ribosomal protein L37AE/L43A